MKKRVTGKEKWDMINCPYCEAENADGEMFCEECGRPLKKPEKKKKILKKYEMISPGNYTYVSNMQIIVQDNCNCMLKYPDTQSLKGGKWELAFRMEGGCNLTEYLSAEDRRKRKEFVAIERRLLQMFEEVQSKELIIGSCDLEDFFLVDNDVNRMVLRVVRPLLSKNKLA
ncbi:MAG: zinc-ribbon domain-containing protein, partial [Ruminococcus flavefaciens]|nr:zinc-ribbon domain-containing protein [Ruminococcus flavefaciens]